MKRLDAWRAQGSLPIPGAALLPSFARRHVKMPTIVCTECERRVPLWDEFERKFAEPQINLRVRQLQDESALVLDNEGKEGALVGDVISTVELAGQICRESSSEMRGTDMVLEFTSDDGKPTGKCVFLQVRSSEFYIRDPQGDGTEQYVLKRSAFARAWLNAVFPVMLIVRSARGEVEWMDIRHYLAHVAEIENKLVNHVVFSGRRFDVMTVRRWRATVLGTS